MLSRVSIVLLSWVLCQTAFAGFINLGYGCNDRGVVHQPDDVWYHHGECARYGCFNPDNPMAYKVTCPQYPIPDCRYRLVSSPDSPFPKCCIVPVCV
ncbi:U-scoloptoxin(16)-Sa1a-like [Babylonia areolata]|uniref:U-scoloptoxin(16)-Sa1a-like n=1 Tax=Babylonia areolata TaxID=304850 RepID=UPI003FD4B29C